MSEKTKLESLEEAKKLLKEHDWFFDYSDDMRDWRKGSQQRQAIIQSLKKVPLNKIEPLIKEYCPEELQIKWMRDIHLNFNGIPDYE